MAAASAAGKVDLVALKCAECGKKNNLLCYTATSTTVILSAMFSKVLSNINYNFITS